MLLIYRKLLVLPNLIGNVHSFENYITIPKFYTLTATYEYIIYL